MACYGGQGNPSLNTSLILSVPSGEYFGFVSAGYLASCGVTIDGRIVCWGQRFPTGVPAGANFKYVSAYPDGACAITSTGDVVCWGGTLAGTISVSNTLRLSASTGSSGVCALSVSGGIACGGDVANGISGIAPPPTAALVHASVGYGRACGITPAAGAVCWGLPSALNVSSALLAKAVLVSVGYYVLCAMSSGGTIACTGINSNPSAMPLGGFVPTGVSWRTVCAPGSILTGGLPGTCTPCPVGTSALVGALVCLPCPPGVVAPAASPVCTPCAGSRAD